ncbi:MAG: filamentous hemagglutinin N-terminal domain-containing protein, partial [Alphaproteobacteria bacterium]|nr:filamentous hemagglutinin N-terminal domain-containing protein [Alphaproteobacteria bacterium]
MVSARRIARYRRTGRSAPDLRLVRRRATPGKSPVALPTERSARSTLITGLLAGVSASALMVGAASANPKNGVVVGGSATIVQTAPNRVDINQSTDKAIINWGSYSIGAGERVNYNQPSASSVTLNRVSGVDPSVILGQITANGKIMLINPNGILFGAGSRVDVGGLIASTTNIRNDDFLAGKYNFNQPSTSPNATVVNDGTINVAEGGLVALVAPGVANNGVINARLGKVSLASANSFTVDFFGDKLINIAVDDKVTQKMVGPDGQPIKAAVSNAGKILADGGTVQITANLAKNVLDQAINMSGIVEARTVAQRQGKIILGGGENGVVAISGSLDATGKSAGEKGGKVVILGEKIALNAGASVDASGAAGGGKVLVGGDQQGQGKLPHAQSVYVDKDATIKADALDKGDGGKVVVWSDQYTRFDGTISAKGGPNGGNGGYVETSSKGILEANGSVSASAPKGKAGTWLLDPYDVTIQLSGTSNGSFSGGSPDVFTPTGNSSVANASVIMTDLDAGTNVTIQTTGAGAQAGNITVNVAGGLDHATGGTATLTLNASGTISIGGGGITNTGGAGNKLNLVLNANGAITQTAAISVSGSTTINATGGTVTLTNAGNSFGGAVAVTTTGSASIANATATQLGASTIGGTLTVAATGAITQTGALTVTGTSSFNAGANAVTLTTGTNALGGAVSLTASTASLTNTGATTLGAAAVAGNLSVTSSGALAITGAVNVTGGGNFSATAGGAVTQTAALAVAGTTTVNAGANAITLINAGNALTGAVALTTTGANA